MEHKEILKLLKERDPKLVEEKIRDHIFHLVEKLEHKRNKKINGRGV